MSLTPERVADIMNSSYAHEIPPVKALCEDWLELRKKSTLYHTQWMETSIARDALRESNQLLLKRAADAEADRDLHKSNREAANSVIADYSQQLRQAQDKHFKLEQRIEELEAKLAGIKQEWRIAWTWGVGRIGEEDYTTPASRREALTSTWQAQVKSPEAFLNMRMQVRDIYVSHWKDVEPA